MNIIRAEQIEVIEKLVKGLEENLEYLAEDCDKVKSATEPLGLPKLQASLDELKKVVKSLKETTVADTITEAIKEKDKIEAIESAVR